MKLSTKLQNIIKDTDNELKKFVCEDILDSYTTDEEIKTFFNDLSQHGCVSGMVSALIYYTDTHEFYNNFASEIDELKEEMENSLGESLKITGDTRNWLAWFGYEEMARIISDEIGL